jgi:Ca2+-binding RTX toxin-like protein
MANFIVVSPSQSSQGGNSGDLFVFRSGGISGATVIGGTGSDTLEFNAPAASAAGVDVALGGGADVFALSAVNLSGNLKGGAGGDTITISGASQVSDVALGAGSDVVNVRGAVTQAGGDVIQGGAGADRITGATDNALSGASVLLGAGKDTLTLSATIASGLINGGGGADVITFDNRNTFNNATIKGGAGADTLTLGGDAASGNVLLGDGSDFLQFSGSYSNTGQILGGAGADRISGNGDVYRNAAGLTIGGGAGKDTIVLSEIGSAGSGAIVLGGGGNDSISLTTHNVAVNSAGAISTFSAGRGLATIHG